MPFNQLTSGTGTTQIPTGTTPAGNIKKPIPVLSPIPNPLHNLASWTYNWSLWWLSPADHNKLMTGIDIGVGLQDPLSNSYVVAESGGIYANNTANPNQRLPSTGGLNYYISSVEFESLVTPNTTTKHTNLITGKMTVMEPYGVTFLDALVYAAVNPATKKYTNHTQQPYLLQLDFVGYDDNGDPIPSGQTSLFRKRFPVQIVSYKVSVDNGGSRYEIEFIPIGHKGYHPEHASCPKQLTMSGTTVNDVLTSFANQLNEHWQNEAADSKVQWADSILFKIDPAIANSPVVYTANLPLSQRDPTSSTTVDQQVQAFIAPKGTSINEVIDRICLQSKYILGQLGLNLQQNNVKDATAAQQFSQSLTQIFNKYRIVLETQYIGTNKNGGKTATAYDDVRNTWPVQFKYCIHQYPIFDSAHPALPSLTDSRPYIVKQYNYLYNSKNIDIVDFKLQFDTTWYTRVAAYNNNLTSTQTTAGTGVDNVLANAPMVMLSPNWLAASGVVPAIGKVPNLNPIRYSIQGVDQKAVTGFGLGQDSNKATAADAIESTFSYTYSDMITVDLTIVGDPTLVKQDDWLYVPDPTVGSNYNSWDVLPNDQFAKTYGHIRMDVGALIVQLNVQSSVDIDTDWTNQGLMFPLPGTNKSLFTGLYKIASITNQFTGSEFTQVLKLYRLMNSDYITASQLSNGINSNSSRTGGTAVSTTTNALNSNNTAIPANTSTPAAVSTDSTRTN